VARGLSFSYGDRPVLAGLDFEVAEGEIFGLLGPNGSGKSTVLAVLAGLLEAESGTVQFRGQVVSPRQRDYRAALGVVFQSPSLDLKLTARENLVLAASLQGLRRRTGRRLADRAVAQVGLADRANESVETLSGGMRRRLDLARALIHQPRLLLMDEPTAGLDESAFRSTWQVLQRLRRETALTIVLSTHRPEEADRCDRLAVLDQGRADAIDTPEALRRRVAGDVLVIAADEPEGLRETIAGELGLEGIVDEAGALHLECERGHEVIPRLVEIFPNGRLRSVSLRRPSLADAFLKITGRELGDDEPPASET
jgi:ABC-2 type transport system ATP-binding protein